MIDDTESHLRDLLHRRADQVDEHAVTGHSVRAYAERPTRLSRLYRRGSVAWAPMATAAAIVALIAGVTVSVLDDSPSSGRRPSAPAVSGQHSAAPTATTGHGDNGPVPQCPSTTHAPGSSNTVCRIGRPPSLLPGQVLIITPSR